MGDDANRRPPSTRVGAHVRIKPAHQQDVEALFSNAGVSPIYKEVRADGNVSYWFAKERLAELEPVLGRISLDCWAHYAVIGSPAKP